MLNFTLNDRVNIVLRNDPKSILYFNFKYKGSLKVKGKIAHHFSDNKLDVFVYADGKHKLNDVNDSYVNDGNIRNPIYVRVKKF